MEKEENVKRENPIDRDHDMYFESEHWTVVDFSGVDHLFVAGPLEGDEEIRVDIDGFVEPSSEVGEEGDNINISVWIPLEKAQELKEELEDKIT